MFLHLRLFELAKKLRPLGNLLLQTHRILLDRTLGLAGRLQRLVVKHLDVLDVLFRRDKLCRERLCRVLVLRSLGFVAIGASLIGHLQGLTSAALDLLNVLDLALELHLQLPLIRNYCGGLLGKLLVLLLGVRNSLLNLNFRIGVFFDLRIEQCHEVVPRLAERVSHRSQSLYLVYEHMVGGGFRLDPACITSHSTLPKTTVRSVRCAA